MPSRIFYLLWTPGITICSGNTSFPEQYEHPIYHLNDFIILEAPK